MDASMIKEDPVLKSLSDEWDLSPEELETLRRSIEAGGGVPHDRIAVAEDGTLLDGHHRWDIAGTKCKTRVVRGLKTQAEREAYVLHTGFVHRNLSPEQKAAVRKKMVEVAKKLRSEGKSQERTAALLGVAESTVELWESKRKREHKHSAVDMFPGIPDTRVKVSPKEHAAIHDQVKEAEKAGGLIGRIAAKFGITRQHLRRIVKKEEKRRKIKEQHSQPASELPDGCRLECGDFRELGQTIADDSVDFIFTDPPYDEASISLYGDLAELAARVLRDGGWCLAYSGNRFLVEVCNIMQGHLEYQWMFAVQHTGGDLRFRSLRLHNKWKPVVGFTKPPVECWWEWFPDMATGGRAKDHHEWEQPEAEAAHFIEALSPEHGVVFDPMCGSGTSVVAAKKLGRQWIAFDKDDRAIEKTQGRLAAVVDDEAVRE
jgi:site-specific DNA-methyltransferase (adenine-specific)